MGYVKVDPWKKDPLRLLLANSPKGEPLGWLDLETGKITIETIDHAAEVATALTRWYQGHRDAEAQIREASARAEELARKEARWRDFAQNQPGQETRRRAEAIWEKIRKNQPRYSRIPEFLHLEKRKPWVKSAKGEERIARILRRMERKGQWRVLHSIPIAGGGDIDHLLIGTDGVIVINTRYYPMAKMAVTPNGVFVDGARTRAHEQARRQAEKVSEALTKAAHLQVKAIPCIALYNGGLVRPGVRWAGSPRGMIVATNWNLRHALCEADQGLTDEQVTTIYEAARRSTTWAR